jgi:hypothetical protein
MCQLFKCVDVDSVNFFMKVWTNILSLSSTINKVLSRI